MSRSREASPARDLVESIRRACIEAALAGHEDAGLRGLCPEGAFEAAVGAMRRADLAGPLRQAAALLAGPGALRVRDVMTTEVATLRADDVLSVAEDVMGLGRIRHLPVVAEGERLCGLVSQRDLLRSALLAPAPVGGRLRVADVMTREVTVTAPDVALHEAAVAMLRLELGCLPVAEAGRLVGIVTEADFVRLALGAE